MLLRLLFLVARARFAAAGARLRSLGQDGFTVRYWDVGPPQGPPWVLLHGIAATAFSWTALLGSLGRRHRLLIPELSELGGTRGPRPALGIAEGASLALALSERYAGRHPTTLAGISLGGWMAIRAALDRPEPLGRLVLVEPAGYRHQDWDRIQRLVSLTEKGDVGALLGVLFRRPPRSFRWSRAAFHAVFTSPAVAGLLATLGQADLFGDEELARLQLPTALIWAEDDGLFLPGVGARMARALPWARLYRVPAAGHALHWERPRAFRRAVERAARELPLWRE